MNTLNNTMRRALNQAIAAVFTLSDQGCVVTEIRIEGVTPRLCVDRRPMLAGRITRSSASFYSPKTHCYADMCGCRVHWDESQSIAQLEEAAA
ncbi:MAG: hypothetical protein ABI843_02405 [Dokdonella sp.]